MILLALLASHQAHVRLLYTPGQVGPIRNANSPTGNGAASVNRACGGANTFGANGKGTVQDGQTVTLTINYAAGHQSADNAFRMAYACGDGSPATVEAPSATLTAAANGCTAKVSGTAAPYSGTSGVAAPNAIVPGGYEITCTLPTRSVTTATECTISVLDQRQWGGCVDVDVLPAAAALPPAPPPSPFVSNQGRYAFSTEGIVNTSGPFLCCGLTAGDLTVPAHAMGAQSFVANLNDARASGCKTTPSATAPSTRSIRFSKPLLMNLFPGSTNKYVGQILASDPDMGSQPFNFSVEQGRLSFTNIGEAQPIVCDGFAALVGAPGGNIGGGGGEVEVPPALKISLLINAASVETVTLQQQTNIRTVVASRLNVDISRVGLTLIAGSVLVQVEVSYDSRADADADSAKLARVLPTSASWNAALQGSGVLVVEDPSLAVTGPSSGSSGGLGGWGIAAIILLVLVGGIGVYIYIQRKNPPPAPKMVTLPNAHVPPPPGPPPEKTDVLPPGWQMMTDPASGHNYYYNSMTGVSTWTRP